jgi:hypothetical protein
MRIASLIAITYLLLNQPRTRSSTYLVTTVISFVSFRSPSLFYLLVYSRDRKLA